jgi:pimeloyl-ACP methyl ester carboxylesterase
MPEPTTQFIGVGEGASARRIAVLAEEGDGPTLLWLGGFMSKMTATKATALAGSARAHARAMLRLDYSGHGQSEGSFESGTITRWLEEAEAVFQRFAAGPLVIVGSSMGAWISLLLAQRLAQLGRSDRIRGMVLIAPAVDMTEVLIWEGMSEADRATLLRDGRVVQPTPYGPEPYVITRALIEDGRQHLFGQRPIALPCPVRILHGQRDPDVPWRLSLELAERFDAPSVNLTLIKEGDHRLSRPEDIALLLATVAGL